MLKNKSCQPIKISFFAHNRKDAAVVRRANSFADSGLNVLGFMFRRDGEQVLPGPAWKNVDLGYVEHCQHAKRLLLLAKTVWRLFVHRKEIANSDVIYARNLDMLGLAFIGLLFVPSAKVKVVYECLDVHDAMTKNSLSGKVLRWLERWALAHIDLLVVSSPGFMREYFIPTQKYQGKHALVENKLYFHEEALERPNLVAPTTAPLVIAWVGVLRCQETLSLLIALAKAEPLGVKIRMSGTISEFLIPDFKEQIASYSNIEFCGAYKWPKGLSDAYAGAHLVWSQELSWKGFNSDWLLPNRIYEASFFGVLSLAVKGTETARSVAERGLGYALDDAEADTLIKFVRGLDHADIEQRQKELLSRPNTDFVAEPTDILCTIQSVLEEKPCNVLEKAS